MTKKAINEKYTKLLQEGEEIREYYKQAIEIRVNKYCTFKEIQEEHFSDLVIMALDRIEEPKEKKSLLRKYASYEKARREIEVFRQICEDIQ